MTTKNPSPHHPVVVLRRFIDSYRGNSWFRRAVLRVRRGTKPRLVRYGTVPYWPDGPPVKYKTHEVVYAQEVV